MCFDFRKYCIRVGSFWVKGITVQEAKLEPGSCGQNAGKILKRVPGKGQRDPAYIASVHRAMRQGIECAP